MAYVLGAACLMHCSEGDIWLNDPEVRRALHAAPVSRQKWVLCTALITFTHDMGSMIPIHTEMTQQKGGLGLGFRQQQQQKKAAERWVGLFEQCMVARAEW